MHERRSPRGTSAQVAPRGFRTVRPLSATRSAAPLLAIAPRLPAIAPLLLAMAPRLPAMAPLLLAITPLLLAMAPPQLPERVVLSGQVLVGDLPADTGTVVLHRVSPTFTGEVDSTRVGPDGAFEVPVPELAVEPSGDVFFASIRYRNVLYVGGAITSTADLADTYVIRAHPTVGAGPGISLPVRVRNLFAVRDDPGPGWSVTDLFELRNDFGATVVASEAGASWSYALPPGAVDFEVGDSDLPPGAASFGGGRLHVSAPIPPGESVYLVRYRIPAGEFTIPLEGITQSMELLIREPAGDLSVAGLMAAEPITLDDVTYRRFAAREVAPSTVRIGTGSQLLPGGNLALLAVVLALALALVGAILALRTRTRPPAAAADRRRRVLVEVARLDERWNAQTIGVEEYDRRRRELLSELDG